MKPVVFVLAGALCLPHPSPLAAQCPVGSTAGTTQPFLLKLTQGESRRSRSTIDNTVSQTMMGQHQETHMVMSSVTRYDVLGLGEDGLWRIRLTTESMRVSMNLPMNSFTWDSSDTTAVVPPGAEMYRAMVGTGYTIAMAPDGSSRHVEGWDTIVDRMLDAVQLPPGVGRDDARAMMKRTVGDQFLDNALDGAVNLLPAQLVEVGDSWSCTSDTGGPFPVHQASTMTLKKRENGVSTVDVVADIATDTTSLTSMGPMTMRYVMKGGSTGTSEIEDATGWVVRGRLEIDMEGTATMEGSPMGPMEIPMTTKMIVITEPIS